MSSPEITTPAPINLWRIAANSISIAVLGCGLIAITFRESLVVSIPLMLLAAALDVADGTFARRAGGYTRAGAFLDIPADFIAFGVGPVALIISHRPELDPPGFASQAVFLGAAIFRLVRSFRRYADIKEGYIGLPMPAAGGLLIALCLLLPYDLEFIGAVITAALAISTIRYPSLGRLWQSHQTGVIITGVLSIAAAFWDLRVGLAIATIPYAVCGWLAE